MKKLETEYLTQEATWGDIEAIIDGLFSEMSEVWLCLYDTSKKNPSYIQIHSDLEAVDLEKEAHQFLLNRQDGFPLELEGLYLIEYRHYKAKDDFRHYRAYYRDSERIKAYFWQYYNNKVLDTTTWLDVTADFS